MLYLQTIADKLSSCGSNTDDVTQARNEPTSVDVSDIVQTQPDKIRMQQNQSIAVCSLNCRVYSVCVCINMRFP